MRRLTLPRADRGSDTHEQQYSASNDFDPPEHATPGSLSQSSNSPTGSDTPAMMRTPSGASRAKVPGHDPWPITIRAMQLNSHHQGRILEGKLVIQPLVTPEAVETALEDPTGDIVKVRGLSATILPVLYRATLPSACMQACLERMCCNHEHLRLAFPLHTSLCVSAPDSL
jgi:hypothetical protein